ncbi:winged helix-turn-helix domain-containing protein [Halobellus ruber]|uniref:Helix-turn-helix domain-containing protein n=1 Tax=Halobellus ruber TaxID=2761102 RepID=A0A7J9SDZ8_9EURY|nr:winged helix-turn-helix domain-containing protein [Halobellus ruber]MBB6644752.1 helix-turn-helix domain-containing protein [Halobellus ruber]
MADLLPSRPDISDDDKDPRVVGLDSDEVDDLLAAISSETARDVLATLHDEPGAPSDVADRIDTSIQNAQYHLDRLETAGLIEAAGTAYSEKGREMTVYAPSDGALVVVAGPDEEATGLQSALTQLLGGIGAVALGSVVVDRLARTGAAPAATAEQADADGGGAGGIAANDSATAAPTSEPTPTQTAGDDGGVRIAEATGTPAPTEEPAATPQPEPTSTETAADLAGTAVETTAASGGGSEPLAGVISGLPPGALFFLGGVLALLFVTALRVR